MKAGEAFIKKWQESGEEFISNAVFEGRKQMERWTKEIHNNQVINNIANKNIQQPVTINQEIHVVCPGVTKEEVARQLPGVLDQAFSGFHNYVDQQSRIR